MTHARRSRSGIVKRAPVLPPRAARFHARQSKATLHEALLDLWLEHAGLDIPTDLLTDARWESYEADVLRRAELRRRQG